MASKVQTAEPTAHIHAVRRIVPPENQFMNLRLGRRVSAKLTCSCFLFLIPQIVTPIKRPSSRFRCAISRFIFLNIYHLQLQDGGGPEPDPKALESLRVHEANPSTFGPGQRSDIRLYRG